MPGQRVPIVATTSATAAIRSSNAFITNSSKINSNLNSSSNCQPQTQSSPSQLNQVQTTAKSTESLSIANDDQKVISVEEFCPDGDTLDKNFLDDLPTPMTPTTATKVNVLQNDDSDSDSNDNGNPMVAKYHDDPTNDLPTFSIKSTTIITESKHKPKVNPLAKSKSKSSNVQMNLIPFDGDRHSSLSSDEIDVLTKSSTKLSLDETNQGVLSNDEFDSWLLDTNQRRSPEGGEDNGSLPISDKKSTFEQIHDDKTIQDESSGDLKEKKHKKKKSKKERHENDEKSTSKKKHRRSKQIKVDECLTGSNESNTIDDSYEPL